MFDLSFAETLVIIVIGLLVLGPKELPQVVKAVRTASAKIKELGNQLVSTLDDIEQVSDIKKEVEQVNQDIQKIVDLDGNLQQTYDLSDVMPEVETFKQKRQK